jgi:hypothetical protein
MLGRVRTSLVREREREGERVREREKEKERKWEIITHAD